ncbi:MAG TPA: TlpA disulfide reductase family protein [Bryobacteraceae bacterium]|nr:TlpA disulfide reductase family protein [Bryobacteraceae bacterium]
MLIGVAPLNAAIVRDVRAALARNDFATAAKIAADFRSANGVTAETAEAYSWLARGAWNLKHADRAESLAVDTRRMALELLRSRKLDADSHLPVALGASIEVQAQVMTARGERDQAVTFLRDELGRWRDTSIRARIQKNLNVLSLEGKPAPAIPGIDAKGRPVLVFLWAHWCPDCKAMAPTLARIEQEYGPKGLLLVAPTQRYGYTKRGADATPVEETKYIEQIRREHYGAVKNMPAPIDEEVFRTYGASTTPTIVLIDRAGIVRLYHPAEMTYEELAPKIEPLVKPLSRAAEAR